LRPFSHTVFYESKTTSPRRKSVIKTKRVAIYARVSTDLQDEGMQLTALREMVVSSEEVLFQNSFALEFGSTRLLCTAAAIRHA
jgi:predicted site-specific integrase-resolvase